MEAAEAVEAEVVQPPAVVVEVQSARSGSLAVVRPRVPRLAEARPLVVARSAFQVVEAARPVLPAAPPLECRSCPVASQLS